MSEAEFPAVVDVLIIGGGIIGSCIAYFLQEYDPGLRVAVVEKDSSYRYSSTTLSAAAIRQQFNLGINVRMSQFSWDFYEHADENLRIDNPVDLHLEPCPYLTLSGVEGEARARAAFERQREVGAEVALIEGSDLPRRFPWLNSEGLSVAFLGLRREGFISAREALLAIRRKASALGAAYIEGSVSQISLDSARVLLDGSHSIRCRHIVNAAGARAGHVARSAGLRAPLEARKRCAFIFRAAHPPQGFVNLIDPTFEGRGIYARPYADAFMAVTSPTPHDDRDTESFDIDESLFERVIRPGLARRVAGFREIQLQDGWAGHYEFNTFDQNAILGYHPTHDGWVWACGLSGHGVMHAPAIGRGIAELLVHGSYRSLDLTCFGYERIEAGKPLDDIQASEQRKNSAGV